MYCKFKQNVEREMFGTETRPAKEEWDWLQKCIFGIRCGLHSLSETKKSGKFEYPSPTDNSSTYLKGAFFALLLVLIVYYGSCESRFHGFHGTYDF